MVVGAAEASLRAKFRLGLARVRNDDPAARGRDEIGWQRIFCGGQHCRVAQNAHKLPLAFRLNREIRGKLVLIRAVRASDTQAIRAVRHDERILGAALRESLAQADRLFESKFGVRRTHQLNVEAKGSRDELCLQACDYLLWALQRHFERGESGYIEMLWDKVGEIVDLDLEHGGRRGKIYNQKIPLFLPRDTDSA